MFRYDKIAVNFATTLYDVCENLHEESDALVSSESYLWQKLVQRLFKEVLKATPSQNKVVYETLYDELYLQIYRQL